MGSIVSVVLLMAPADGLVPSPPGAEAPVMAPSATVMAPVEAKPTAVTNPTPTTPDLVRARAAQPLKEAPPAPEPDASSSVREPFEIGGFMDRPAPAAPVGAASYEDPSSTDPEPGELVWGIHRPVAKWKRSGLIGSGVLTGVAIATAVGTRIEGQRRLDEVSRYLEGRTSADPITACRQNTVSAGGGAVLVDDVGLASRCQRFERMRVARGVSIGLSVVGIVSTATFGILHLVHRQEPRRVEARTDGFAVRF